jgi:glycosyltransferase involved in cell wall biosynthesis
MSICDDRPMPCTHTSMPKPFVSIVMTAYNAVQFLPISIAAALLQDYTHYEVIVFDDGSTDASSEICEAIPDKRLRYLRRDRVGRGRALNEAIALAAGEYIAINDADDLSFPNRLMETIRFLKENDDVSLVGTDYVATDVFPSRLSDGLNVERYPATDRVARITAARLYRSNPFIHSTVVYTKAAWEKVGGYDENLPMCIDYDFFLRLSMSATMAWLPMKTVLHWVHRDSFFRQKPQSDYLATLIHIKDRAWTNLQLPFWLRIYDVMPYWLALSSSMVQRLK